MPIRVILVLALLFVAHVPALAAEGCPVPVHTSKAPEQITDWYEKYISPFRTYAGMADNPRPTKEQIEARVDTMEEINHRTLADSLQFEALVKQITAHYERSTDFKGLDSKAAEKIYRPGSPLDFAALCIDTRSLNSPDDTFGITLFGVTEADCGHTGLRGMVFTNTLINGAADGRCRPDVVYYKRWIIPVTAGTNTVTFLCSKDVRGCDRR
jgi:hypothetical protein